MWIIKNIIFAVFFIFVTVFLSIIAIFLRLSQKYLVAIYKIWGKIILFLADKIYGIKYQIIGLENIKDEPRIIASKHQSMWETIIFLVLFDKISYILKIYPISANEEFDTEQEAIEYAYKKSKYVNWLIIPIISFRNF